MKSMTGYGRGSGHLGNLEITLELHSVNRKNLDCIINLPREWQALEADFLSVIKESVHRGRLVVTVQAQAVSDSDSAGDFDINTIRSLYAQLQTSCKALGVKDQVSSELVFQLALYAKKNQVLPAVEEAKAVSLEALKQAISSLLEMRQKEGDALRADLLERKDILAEVVSSIEERSSGSVERYRELLFQRLRQAELELDPSDERVLKEIALFADRCDITEEITRLKSHLVQLEDFLGSEDAVGRRIDFLLQEMNRESNTIGSKANDIEISRNVISLKNELERIREQALNIE